MILRERRDAAFAAGSFRKDPLHEVNFLADIALAIRSGSQPDKIGAMMRLSRGIERGAVSKKESSDILCEALEDSDSVVKRNAIMILARHGSDFLGGLCMGLANEDLQVRAMSAAMIKSVLAGDGSAFRSMGEEEQKAVSLLFSALICGERSISSDAFSALKEIALRMPLLVLDSGVRADDPETAGRLRAIERTALGALRERSAGTEC